MTRAKRTTVTRPKGATKRHAKVAAAVVVAMCALPLAVHAQSVPDIAGTRCPRVNASRVVKKVSYRCVRVGRSLSWRRVAATKTPKSSTTGAAGSATTTTVAVGPCRSISDINSRLPFDQMKSEWERVVQALQPVAATADPTGRTRAVIDTYDDPQIGILNYGRYYAMQYPSAVPETQGGRCAYLALVLNPFVSFTGADTSDDTAKSGIHASIKALLHEVVRSHRTINGLNVDVVLFEPLLDHCPGRAIQWARVQCPWNDYGYLYYRLAALTPEVVGATAAADIFSLAVSGAVFPPRPFTQIIGIGPAAGTVSAGTNRNLVPDSNKNHQSSTYVEYSDRTFELGQSFTTDAALAVGSITIRTVGHVGTVGGRPVSGSGPAIAATMRTRIMRYDGSGEIPPAVSRSNFTTVVDTTQSVSIPHYSSFNVALPAGTTLAPGRYLITFSSTDWRQSGMSYVRLESFAEGPRRETDAYPGGRAYRACDLRESIGYRLTDNPPVAPIGIETASTECSVFYAEVSKGENPARGMQHTWVWSDMAIALNAP